jgi:hypothetical protein
VEMGQATYTSLAMPIAEELEVSLHQVGLEPVPIDDALYGATSIRRAWEPLRQGEPMGGASGRPQGGRPLRDPRMRRVLVAGRTRPRPSVTAASSSLGCLMATRMSPRLPAGMHL